MTNPKPNLDLIQMVQQARMIHDATAKPSEIGGVYWIEVKPQDETSAPTARAGDWVIPTQADQVDVLWERIRQATETGQLGYKSKVSTAPGPGQADPNARLIVVCTYDADDRADVERVHEALRVLGLTAEAHYQRH